MLQRPKEAQIDPDRLASARRRLQENYQEAQNGLASKNLQYITVNVLVCHTDVSVFSFAFSLCLTRSQKAKNNPSDGHPRDTKTEERLLWKKQRWFSEALISFSFMTQETEKSTTKHSYTWGFWKQIGITRDEKSKKSEKAMAFLCPASVRV